MLERLGFEAENLEREREVSGVENTHDDLLAVDKREDRNPEVDLPTLDLDLELPVLGTPLLGDVQAGHDLHA